MAKARPVIAAYRALRALDATLEVGGKQIAARDLTLLAVGERHRAFDGEAGVHMTGFVDDETRWQLLHRATALVNPSRYESLSLVLLEAWACGVPVVVNAACDVTVGQCARSDGGFAVDFEDPAAAAKALPVAGLPRSAVGPWAPTARPTSSGAIRGTASPACTRPSRVACATATST